MSLHSRASSRIIAVNKKVVTGEPVSADIVALLDGCTSTFQMLAEQEEGPTDAASKPAAAASSMVRRIPIPSRPPPTYAVGDAAVGADVESWHS